MGGWEQEPLPSSSRRISRGFELGRDSERWMEHGRGFDMRRRMGMSDLLGGGGDDDDDDDVAKGEGAETTRMYGSARAGSEKLEKYHHHPCPNKHTRCQIDQPSLSSWSSFQ